MQEHRELASVWAESSERSKTLPSMVSIWGIGECDLSPSSNSTFFGDKFYAPVRSCLIIGKY